MNFSSLGQQLFSKVSEYLDRINAPKIEGQQPPSLLARFGMNFGFNPSPNNLSAADQNLRGVSTHIQLSNADIQANLAKESARLSQTSQTKQIKNIQWVEGANENGYLVTVRAKDLGMSRWGAVDPKAVARESYEKAILKMGITNDPAKAQEIADKIKVKGMLTETNKGWRPVTASDYADKDWMNARLDRNGNYAVQIDKEEIADILAASKEVLGEDFLPPQNVSKSQLAVWGITITGGGGLAATIAFKGKMISGAGLLSGATPLLLGTLASAPAIYTSAEYLKTAYENGQLRERANQLPIPASMTMEDIGEAPPPTAKPTDTTEKIPIAPSLPTDAELPKGEIAVRPETQPEITVENLPQPVTPDVPKGKQPQNAPQSPKDLDRIVPPVIVGASAGKAISDAVSEKDVAPNGVKNIEKREWTETEYKQWFNNLPKESARTNKPADIYQIIHAGDTEYKVSGGNEEFNADGITDKTILEAKFVGNPERSPYIEDSKYPRFLREETNLKIEDEFRRMGIILRDEDNPLTSVRVITNNERAVPYFEKLMRKYGVPGEIIVNKETDILEDK